MTSEPRYTVAISKGAGLVQAFRRLLGYWQPRMPVPELTRLAQESGAFGDQSAYRTEDIVTRVFAPRLLRPDELPARCLKTVLDADLGNDVFGELLMVFSARSDALFGDFVADVFWPAAQLGRGSLAIADALTLIESGEASQRIPKPWSEQVKVKVSRGLLGALRDYGFLDADGAPSRPRGIIKRSVSHRTVLVLALELKERGAPTEAIVRSGDWRVLGLREQEVVAILVQAAPAIGAVVQAGGGAVQIAWPDRSMEELIRAAA